MLKNSTLELLRYEAQIFFFLLFILPLLWLIRRWPLLLLFLSSQTFIDIWNSSQISFPWLRHTSFTFRGGISPKVMIHHLVPLITHPSMTFHHVPESGLCAYPRSINIAPLCNSSSKLGLLSACLQSSFLVQRSLSSPIRRKPRCHKFFDNKNLLKLETVSTTVQARHSFLLCQLIGRTSVSSWVSPAQEV